MYAADGRCRGANRAAADLLGIPSEMLLSQNLCEIHLWKESGVLRRAEETMRTGAPQRWEARFTSTAGKTLWLHFRTELADLAGERGLLLVLGNITERTREEAERKQLIDGMNDTAIVLSFEGEFLEVNDRAIETLGYSRGELLAMSVADIDPHLSPGDVADLIEENRLGRRRIFETLHKTKAGRIFPVEISASLVSFRGKPAILSVARDISDRRRAEETLRESEERYRVLADATSDLIFSFDRDLRLVGINRAAATIIGQSAETALGKSLRELGLPAEADTRWQAACAEVLATGQALENLVREMPFPGGAVRTIETALHPIRAADGSVSGVRGMARDVTDRARAEAMLEGSRQRLRLHVERTPLAVIEFGPDGRVAEWNPGAKAVFGYSREEALGQPWTFIVPEASRLEVDGVRESLIAQAGGLRSTNENVTRDGRLIHCEWYNTPLIGPDGRSIGVASLVMDVTERERAEEKLRASEERFRALYENSPDAVFITSPNGRVHAANPAACAMFEMTEQELIAGGRDVILDPADSRITAALRRRTRTGRFVGEFTFRRKMGTTFPGEIASQVYQGDDGELYTAMTVRDLTDRRRSEEALALAEAQLRQAQKMEAVGQLAGCIAHDFNNLLTAIIGNSDLMLQALPPDDPNRELVADIRDVGERAANLTRQILAFSRRQMLSPRVLCLNEIVESIRPLLGRTLGEDIHLEVVMASDLRSTTVDPNQLEQVLMNLAVNARDAMPQGGHLAIKTANAVLNRAYCRAHPELKPGRYVLLSVSDDGCGMDEHTKSRMFEPFFTSKEMGKGTGLGLSTVLGIVQQSGGSISVESEPAKGTTFKVYLPAHKQSAPSEEEPSRAPKPAKGTETVLVVEDEALVRELMVRVLTRSGYKVLEAGSAAEGLAVLATTELVPDLLLTDMVLPGGEGGRALAEQAQACHPSLSVIFASGYTQDSAVFDGSLGKDIDFLNKPFTPGELLEKVRAALDKATTCG